MAAIIARGTILYLGTVNMYSFGLFGYDKMQASRGEWRVPERKLCQTAVYGGSAGGLLAMQAFRHKTRKKSFQEKYVAAMGQNLAVMGTMLLIITRSVHVRRAFGQEWRKTGRVIKNMLGNKR